jgi:hypothetical protein
MMNRRSDSRARRRRGLVIRQAAQWGPESRDAPMVATAAFPVVDAAAASPPQARRPEPAQPPGTKRSRPAAPPPAGGRTAQDLRGLLERPALTWLLVGESFEPPHPAGRDWRNMAARLSDAIRHSLGRRQDVVAEQLCPGQRLSGLTEVVRASFARLHPDLVLISLGGEESSAGRRGLADFEQRLASLTVALQRMNVLPILCTPPYQPHNTEAGSSVEIDALIYAEAVRATAAEYDVPLVDHFAHWEAAAARARGNADWFDAGTSIPGRYGHEQLARRILSDLGLTGEPAHRPGGTAPAGGAQRPDRPAAAP